MTRKTLFPNFALIKQLLVGLKILKCSLEKSNRSCFFGKTATLVAQSLDIEFISWLQDVFIAIPRNGLEMFSSNQV